MTLVEVNRLGYLAGKHWLTTPIEHYRTAVERLYDAASDDRQRDIQAAWATGWRFGFGPVAPKGGAA